MRSRHMCRVIELLHVINVKNILTIVYLWLISNIQAASYHLLAIAGIDSAARRMYFVFRIERDGNKPERLTMYRAIPTIGYVACRRLCGLAIMAALLLAACQPGSARPALPSATPTVAALMRSSTPVAFATAIETPVPLPAADITVTLDRSQGNHPISPFIYGLNAAPADVLHDLRPGLNRWGGNPSTRYNWKLGNAWNAGSDWFYRNGDYGYTGASASDDFVRESLAAGSGVLLTVPTLGWVAKNNDPGTCSFPTGDGQCGDAAKANCESPGPIADPQLANVRSDSDSVAAWIKHLVAAQHNNLRFVAMDNEPDLWGYTHYDVHPTCTSYDEIRDTYIRYASAVRDVAPQSELLGPVSCCWYFYWNSAAGAADRANHDDQDFLPWFLGQLRQHDAQHGRRTLDVLDVHFYPEGLYNDNADPDTAARRLRSTRSLWDRSYADESWIAQPIYLIPRLKQLIDQHYPGTKLGISEWNWGADTTMNGALALAEVLGILGREDVYLANYWRYPAPGTAGYYAFKLFTNYDDQGGHFGDTAIQAISSQPGLVGAYAAQQHASRQLTVLLINKDPQRDLSVALDLGDLAQARAAVLYRYSAADPQAIIKAPLAHAPATSIVLPAYSLSLLVFEAPSS